MNRTIRIYLSVTPEEENRISENYGKYLLSAKGGRKSRNEWIEVREYRPDVEKTYWDTSLRPVWIRTKRINLIKFVEYVKPPKGEGFKP